MQPPKNAFLIAKSLWRAELLVNFKFIKNLKEIIKLYLMEPFNGEGYMEVTTDPLLLMSFLSPSVVPVL